MNLNVKSCYSLLSSTIRVNELVDKMKDLKFSYAAIADQSMYASIKFYLQCEAKGLKPIIGLELVIEDNPFLLYAKNYSGFKNLMKISSTKEIAGKVKFEFIKDNSQGLVFVSRGNYLLNPEKYLTFDLFLGLELEQLEDEEYYFQEILKLGKSYQLPFLILNEVNCLEKEDQKYLKVLNAIRDNTTIENDSYEEVGLSVTYLKDRETLLKSYGDFFNVEEDLNLFLSKFDLKIDFSNYKLPKYPVEKYSSKEYLQALCLKGLEKRLADLKVNKNKYLSRLKYELEVISKMGFDDYFLIVWDFVLFAKKSDILVGPGRGSAAGSLVSYCLGITNTDPIEYNLLFERFLNEERITMPDIDLDFPDDSRDRVIEYVKNKYSKNNVVSIVTFGTFQGRSAIRDVAKVLKIETKVLDKLIKMIPLHFSSFETIKTDEKIEKVHIDYPEIAKLLNYSEKILGLPRHTSTHAAGIIITEKEIYNYAPVQKGIYDLYQSQFEAKDLEKLGLLKIDFLGLSNLKILQKTTDLIYQNTGQKINLYNLTYDDKLVFELLRNKKTDGVFQLESSGIRNVLKKMKVNCFEDIVATLALYRPGPMENIDEFIDRKHGKKFNYLHQNLEEILKFTYGIIVYQEQILMIANKFAGYTLSEADLLRRAVSKKDLELLEKERIRFVKKCDQKKYLKETANLIYDYILKFANYGFNRSHSVAYSMIAYQCAYLKVHYKEYFMISLLNNLRSVDHIEKYLFECKEMKIECLEPSVNKSDGRQFIVEGLAVRMPLILIKDFGSVLVNEMIEERKIGPFIDYENFISRTHQFIAKNKLIKLIHSGALDEFGLNKQIMVNNIEKVINRSNFGMFADECIELEKDKEYSLMELVEYEKKALGFNFKYNLLNKYDDKLKNIEINYLNDEKIGKKLKIFARIISIKVIKTKKGQEMAFLTIEDKRTQIEAILFPKAFEEYKEIVFIGNCYLLYGRINIDREEKKFMVDKIEVLQ